MNKKLLNGYCVIMWLSLTLAPTVFAGTANPHIMRRDKHGCDLCHKSPDFDDPEDMCFSCHQCADAEETSDCLDCHVPHGTVDTVGLLKKDKAQISESLQYNQHDDCEICHNSEPDSREDLDLKFGGDVNFLCRDCHYALTTCRHPVGIMVPDNIKKLEGLTLDSEKKIICTTCHRPDCRGDGSVLLVGFSRKGGVQTNELCRRCHWPLPKNPHINVFQQYNYRTYNTVIYQESGQKSGYNFLTNPRLTCLLCHPERPHPAKNDHRQVFPYNKRQNLKNLQFDSFGRITCTTCHYLHANPGSSCKSTSSCQECHTEYY